MLQITYFYRIKLRIIRSKSCLGLNEQIRKCLITCLQWHVTEIRLLKHCDVKNYKRCLQLSAISNFCRLVQYYQKYKCKIRGELTIETAYLLQHSNIKWGSKGKVVDLGTFMAIIHNFMSLSTLNCLQVSAVQSTVEWECCDHDWCKIREAI